MRLVFLNEFQIGSSVSKEINSLLQSCFTDTSYNGRDYFKQLPNYRILARKEDKLIGHLAIDFRVMNMSGNPINIFGIVDLCVCPSIQRQGVGTSLLKEFEKIAQKHAERVDFLFLATNSPSFYENLGYQKVQITPTWLKVDNHQNFGIAEQEIDEASFLIKPISGKKWIDGKLDFLGYMY